ncbi:MAG: indole-3-glycerol phosphate synthase TrpC [Pseudomonadota bacterium]|nr:indole-3-glycerol phosphate synthase TrpC [Pseudomonadota bacterium]
MPDILQDICKVKRGEVQNRKKIIPLSEMISRAKDGLAVRDFTAALKARRREGKYGLIAEIKKASPSKGVIRSNFNPTAIAKAYEAGGAACLSVLTDKPFFQGADEFLIDARNATQLPVLRKDFMLDPFQIYESRSLGADCILLIMAALSDNEAISLEGLAHDLGMAVLVEVHNAIELDRAARLSSPLIGINNRNLKTLNVDINTTIELSKSIGPNKLLISESGLFSPDDLARMSDAGANCFLIGESLMSQEDVEAATLRLLKTKKPIGDEENYAEIDAH